jgi:hypothetical protein
MLERKLINGLVFKKAFSFNKEFFHLINQELFNSVGGVYAVYVNEKLVYIGSYSNTLQQRWINKRLDKFVHFKADILKEMVDSNLVFVYALTRDSIREQLFDSEYINHESVESRLVEVCNPPLNIVKKNDKNKSSKS